MTTEYRCRHCGYFLLATEVKSGLVQVVCRKCRFRQTVRLEPSCQVEHHHFGVLQASGR